MFALKAQLSLTPLSTVFRAQDPLRDYSGLSLSKHRSGQILTDVRFGSIGSVTYGSPQVCCDAHPDRLCNDGRSGEPNVSGEFLMNGFNLVAMFIAVAINAVIPGPIIVVTCTRAIRSGAWAGIYVVFGVLFADLIWLTIAWWVLTFAFAMSQEIFQAMKVFGTVLILGMAIQSLFNSNPTEESLRLSRHSNGRHFSTGLALGLACPFSMVFMLGILPQLIPISEMTILGGALVAVTMTAATALPLCGLAFIAGRALRFEAKFGRWMSRAGTASLFVFAAIGLKGIM